MKLYRKKPVVIEAVRFTAEDRARIITWIQMHGHQCDCSPDGSLIIPTAEGAMLASKGDWIIKGVIDEFYPCKPHVFAATYEAVEEPQPNDPTT